MFILPLINSRPICPRLRIFGTKDNFRPRSRAAVGTEGQTLGVVTTPLATTLMCRTDQERVLTVQLRYFEP